MFPDSSDKSLLQITQTNRKSPKAGISKIKRPCTCLWPFFPSVTRTASSNQAAPWRPQGPAYRCFLPDLTGFTSLRRTGPGRQHHFSGSDPEKYGPGTGIQPCYSGLQVQGTATSPSSTTKVKQKWRRERDSNPRDKVLPRLLAFQASAFVQLSHLSGLLKLKVIKVARL